MVANSEECVNVFECCVCYCLTSALWEWLGEAMEAWNWLVVGGGNCWPCPFCPIPRNWDWDDDGDSVGGGILCGSVELVQLVINPDSARGYSQFPPSSWLLNWVSQQTDFYSFRFLFESTFTSWCWEETRGPSYQKCGNLKDPSCLRINNNWTLSPPYQSDIRLGPPGNTHHLSNKWVCGVCCGMGLTECTGWSGFHKWTPLTTFTSAQGKSTWPTTRWREYLSKSFTNNCPCKNTQIKPKSTF